MNKKIQCQSDCQNCKQDIKSECDYWDEYSDLMNGIGIR